MADIKLFELGTTGPVELAGTSMVVEKALQNLIEQHCEPFLGVRFLASEYTTGKSHGGRIDTLGIDENNCPVIIEYKRSRDENVMSQGLYYLDWLMDHQAEFELLAMRTLGQTEIDVNWTAPRLLCIAGDFTKYDAHAVQQIHRNIELIRYRSYGERHLILFELVGANAVDSSKPATSGTTAAPSTKAQQRTVTENVELANAELRAVWDELDRHLMARGDDVQRKTLQFYVAYRRIKNFACIEVRPQAGTVLAYLKVPPTPEVMIDGITRDVSNIGHYGTGNLEVALRTTADLERVLPLLDASYEMS